MKKTLRQKVDMGKWATLVELVSEYRDAQMFVVHQWIRLEVDLAYI